MNKLTVNMKSCFKRQILMNLLLLVTVLSMIGQILFSNYRQSISLYMNEFLSLCIHCFMTFFPPVLKPDASIHQDKQGESMTPQSS